MPLPDDYMEHEHDDGKFDKKDPSFQAPIYTKYYVDNYSTSKEASIRSDSESITSKMSGIFFGGGGAEDAKDDAEDDDEDDDDDNNDFIDDDGATVHSQSSDETYYPDVGEETNDDTESFITSSHDSEDI
jgi:hypothetical protein